MHHTYSALYECDTVSPDNLPVQRGARKGQPFHHILQERADEACVSSVLGGQRSVNQAIQRNKSMIRYTLHAQASRAQQPPIARETLYNKEGPQPNHDKNGKQNFPMLTFTWMHSLHTRNQWKHLWDCPADSVGCHPTASVARKLRGDRSAKAVGRRSFESKKLLALILDLVV